MNLRATLENLPVKHRNALLWFFDQSGQVIPWTPVVTIDGADTQVVTKAKGIYKPAWAPYALSVRHGLQGSYKDLEPIFRKDGTWLYRYFQENLDPSSRDDEYTNRALLNCWRDRVPVGVIVQIKPKPQPRYRVLGLALVAGWEDGYFYLEGFTPDGLAKNVQDYEAYVTPQKDQLAILREANFDPSLVRDEREKTLRQITVRRGQRDFRWNLLDAYGAACSVTGCDALQTLEAAHIIPYSGASSNHVSNGLLLRADVHTLFDLRLISVDPGTSQILLASELKETTYRELEGVPLRLPEREELRPNRQCLAAHRALAKL